MTTALRYVLIADGPTDRALLPVVDWAIRQRRPRIVIGHREFVARGGRDLRDACVVARKRSVPGLMLVHRDAEREPAEHRRTEIHDADPSAVPVIPVRMTEAWLLVDEAAIRRAADNPHGRMPLDLPPVRRLETVPDPKSVLRDALLTASDVTGPRRRRRFERDLPDRIDRLASLIVDFRELRQLDAFRTFEEALGSGLDRAGIPP